MGVLIRQPASYWDIGALKTSDDCFVAVVTHMMEP